MIRILKRVVTFQPPFILITEKNVVNFLDTAKTVLCKFGMHAFWIMGSSYREKMFSTRKGEVSSRGVSNNKQSLAGNHFAVRHN